MLSISTTSTDTKPLNINDFQRTYFKIINKESNFYQVNTNLENLKSDDILTSGYLSDDLKLDLVLIDRTTQKLTFMVFSDKDGGGFYSGGQFEFKGEGEKIQAGHFAQTKKEGEDMLVLISKKGEGVDSQFRLKGYLIKTTKDKEERETVQLEEKPGFEFEFSPKVESPGDPLNFQLFDKVTEDGKHNLTSYWLVMNEGKRTVLFFNDTDQKMKTQEFGEFFDTSNPTKKDEEDNVPTFNDKATLPKGGAFYFVDLNYDCRADIVLETIDTSTSTKYLEFYYFTGGNKPFNLIKQAVIGADGDPLTKYSSPRLVDLRQSNSLDLVFYNNMENSLDIFLAQGPNENPQEIQTFCKKSVTSTSDFPFPDIHQNINYTNNTGYSYRIILSKEMYDSLEDVYSMNFHFADLNMNGYPDLVMLTKHLGEDKTGHTQVKGQMLIMSNEKCTDEQAAKIYSGEDFKHRCRLFNEKTYEDYNTRLGEVLADRFGLFDFGERGIIGFFLIDYDNGRDSVWSNS
jgi:hypothetical protein